MGEELPPCKACLQLGTLTLRSQHPKVLAQDFPGRALGDLADENNNAPQLLVRRNLSGDPFLNVLGRELGLVCDDVGATRRQLLMLNMHLVPLIRRTEAVRCHLAGSKGCR